MKRRKPQQSLQSRVCGQTCVILLDDFWCDGEHLLLSVSWELFYGKSAEDTAGRRMWCAVSHVLAPVWVGVFLTPPLWGEPMAWHLFYIPPRGLGFWKAGADSNKSCSGMAYGIKQSICAANFSAVMSPCVFFVTNAENALVFILFYFIFLSNLIAWAAFSLLYNLAWLEA